VLRDPGQMKPYYVKLITGLRHMGIRVETVVHDRWTTLATVETTPGIHIVDHGSWRHPRLLNTGIAYIYPFWNLDPWGIRALSSIAALPFDAAGVDAVAAAEFTARMRKRLVDKRTSRYPQPAEKVDLPPGCIAVFLQSEAHRDVDETCYLTMRQMLTALIARNDPRAIVVKPHPRDADPKTREYLARLAARDPRVQVVDANIHDILAQAAVAVTINSAVGIEAHLHRVPVVCAGRPIFTTRRLRCKRGVRWTLHWRRPKRQFGRMMRI
jgi:Capsule polysaccharide biosynthesis protein